MQIKNTGIFTQDDRRLRIDEANRGFAKQMRYINSLTSSLASVVGDVSANNSSCVSAIADLNASAWSSISALNASTASSIAFHSASCASAISALNASAWGNISFYNASAWNTVSTVSYNNNAVHNTLQPRDETYPLTGAGNVLEPYRVNYIYEQPDPDTVNFLPPVNSDIGKTVQVVNLCASRNISIMCNTDTTDIYAHLAGTTASNVVVLGYQDSMRLIAEPNFKGINDYRAWIII